MSSIVNFNGDLLPKDSAFLNHENRGIKYGDALFETLRSATGTIFFFEDHYLRLMSSMRILRMEIPMEFTMEFVSEQIKNTLEANQMGNLPARIRFTVFRNSGGLYLPNTNEVSFIIEATVLESEQYTLAEDLYEVELFKDFYINADMLSNLKTNNRIINVVGSIYASENGYDNCLLLNQSKQVVEALNGNLFLVAENKIKTPPLKDGCISGIIRKQLIEILKKQEGYSFEEVSISPFELQKADELLITNTLLGIRAVSKYRKANFSHVTALKLLDKLNAKVWEAS